VYFVSSATPAARPTGNQEPRPSASRSASQSTTIVASWSKETGWKSPLVAISSGEKPTATAATALCAAAAAEFARDERRDEHRQSTGGDRERTETHQREADEHARERRQQRR